MKFEWDGSNAASNLQKHGVSFDEARTVFSDYNAVTTHDALHSLTEDRFLVLGRSESGRVLLVNFTERGEKIRLISARVATRREVERYG